MVGRRGFSEEEDEDDIYLKHLKNSEILFFWTARQKLWYIGKLHFQKYDRTTKSI